MLRGRDEPEDAVVLPSGFFYTPDGRRAITVDNRVVRTWDVASWTELGPPLRNDRFVAMVGFNFAPSDAGRFLAFGGLPGAKGVMGPPDTFVRVWELASGREVARFPGYDDSWTELAFSPDGRLLAMFRSRTETQRDPGQSYHQDAAIRLLDVASGREVRRLEGHRGAVNAIAFTRDGRSLISAGEDATALGLGRLGPVKSEKSMAWDQSPVPVPRQKSCGLAGKSNRPGRPRVIAERRQAIRTGGSSGRTD